MPFRDDLLTPISGNSPGGQNLRYDPIRDKIKDARREEVEAPQGAWKTEVKTADWDLVVKLAGETIAKRSKDLQLAVWLVDAQVRKEGFAALAPGFDFLRSLVDDFWDTLHPQIEDGDLEERASILAWLDLKLEEPLRLLPIVSGGLSWFSYKESLTIGMEADAKTQELRQKREQLIGEGKVSGEQWMEAVGATPKGDLESLRSSINTASESLVQLGEVCDKRFLNDAPGFSRIRSTLEEISGLLRGLIQAKGGPTPAAVPVRKMETVALPPVAVQPVPTPEPVQVAEAVPAASGNAGIDPVDVADAERRLSAICRFLRKNDTYDIAPFLILRGLRFGQIRYNGPHKIDPSMLEAPPSGLRAELKKLAAEQNWDELLEATQRAMELPCGRAWLDVQRYTVMALEAKGEWWAFVADAVRTELHGLLSDLPALLDMQLLDDTPTAHPETKKWIEEQLLSERPATAVAAFSAPPENPAPPPDVPWLDNAKLDENNDDVFRKAVADAGNGHLSEALDALNKQLASERSGRGRFLRRVQLAHVLMTARQTRIALPILNQLAAEMETRSLETWEDWTALAYPLGLMLECLEADEASEADRAAIYARICRLDPARALSIRN
ncbi:MAG TPA: type VI secretion system protein TssA [Bryobacteraceae bacterium]